MPKNKNKKRKSSRQEFAESIAADFDDLPDGAFFGVMAEMGIEPGDFASDHEAIETTGKLLDLMGALKSPRRHKKRI